MRDKKNWIIVALLLTLGAGVIYAIHEGDRLAAEKAAALADLQRAHLREQGWLDASRGKDLELDLLREKLEAASEVGSEPAVRVEVVTREVPVEIPGEAIPCPPTTPPLPTDTPSVVVVAPPLEDSRSPLNLPPLFVSARTQLAIDLLADSSLTWTGSTEVRLRRNRDESKVVLPIDPDASELSVGDNLRTLLEQPRAKRVAFGLRRPRAWRVGWSMGFGMGCHLVSSSISFGGDYYQDPVSKSASKCGPAASLGYGIQF